MGMKLTDHGWEQVPDPIVWELTGEEVQQIIDIIAGGCDMPAMRIMIDTEGVKVKVDGLMSVWTPGMGKRVQ